LLYKEVFKAMILNISVNSLHLKKMGIRRNSSEN